MTSARMRANAFDFGFGIAGIPQNLGSLKKAKSRALRIPSTPNARRPTPNFQRKESQPCNISVMENYGQSFGNSFLGRWALGVGCWALKSTEILNVNPPAFRSQPSKHQGSQPRSRRYRTTVFRHRLPLRCSAVPWEVEQYDD